MFLIAGLGVGLVVFEACRPHLSPVWRVTSFLPFAVGIGLLAVTKYMRFW